MSDDEDSWDTDCSITVFPCEDFGDEDGCGDLPSVNDNIYSSGCWTSDEFELEVWQNAFMSPEGNG